MSKILLFFLSLNIHLKVVCMFHIPTSLLLLKPRITVISVLQENIPIGYLGNRFTDYEDGGKIKIL